jgi:hypothetical protein
VNLDELIDSVLKDSERSTVGTDKGVSPPAVSGPDLSPRRGPGPLGNARVGVCKCRRHARCDACMDRDGLAR